jgi:hypothetical protein
LPSFGAFVPGLFVAWSRMRSAIWRFYRCPDFGQWLKKPAGNRQAAQAFALICPVNCVKE